MMCASDAVRPLIIRAPLPSPPLPPRFFWDSCRGLPPQEAHATYLESCPAAILHSCNFTGNGGAAEGNVSTLGAVSASMSWTDVIVSDNLAFGAMLGHSDTFLDVGPMCQMQNNHIDVCMRVVVESIFLGAEWLALERAPTPVAWTNSHMGGP